MSIAKDKYIRISEDIHFLLEICRDLLRIIEIENPNEEIPINIEQIKRLRSIKQIYAR